MRILALAAALAVAAAFSGPAAAQAGDAVAGEKVFKKCRACHKVGPRARNGVGPVLNGVVDSPLGTVEGFKYSKGLLALAAEGQIWDEAALHAYLTKPRAFVAKGKMSFAGLRKEADRANVIAYLRGFDKDGNPAE